MLPFGIGSERRAAQRRMEDTEAQRLATFIDRMPVGMLTVTGGGRIEYSNRAARSILGFDGEGMAPAVLRHHPALLSLIEMAAAAARPMRGVEVRLDSPGRGETYILLDSHVIMVDSSARLNLLFWDITSVREREERLRVRDRLTAIGEVSAMTAHQIKAPLASLILYLQRIGERLEPEHPVREVLGRADREAGRLDHLVRLLLDLVGPARLTVSDVDVEKLVSSVSEAAAGCGAVIDREVLPGLPRMRGDETALRSALLNLVINAAEAGATRVRLRVEHRRPEPESLSVEKLTFSVTGTAFYRFDSRDVRFMDDQKARIQITVSDNGRGIGPDEMNRLFMPFFTTKSRGTGLGLVAVHKIVEAHRGGVLFKSKIGAGSEVIVTLPCEAQ